MKPTKVDIIPREQDINTAEILLESILQKTCDKPRVSSNICRSYSSGASYEKPIDTPVPYFISHPQIQLSRENDKYKAKRGRKKKVESESEGEKERGEKRGKEKKKIDYESLQLVVEKLTQMSTSLNELPVDNFEYFKLYLNLFDQVSGFDDMVIHESLKEVMTERFEAVKYFAEMLYDRLEKELIIEIVTHLNSVLPECSADEVQWFHARITKSSASYLLQTPRKTFEGWEYTDGANCKIDLNGLLLLLCIINEDKLGTEVRKKDKWGCGYSDRLMLLAKTRVWCMQFSSLMMYELPKLKDYLDFHIVLCRHQLDIFQNNENNKRAYFLTILFGILALIATIPSWIQLHQS